MRKRRWLLGTVVVFLTAIIYYGINTGNLCYAPNGCPPSWVQSAMPFCKWIPGKKIKRCWCKRRDGFQRNDDVYTYGKMFDPLTTVDVYVTCNKTWTPGDLIGGDVGDGVDTLTTDSVGNLPCFHIWRNPLGGGKFDIVVDVNQDGTYNNCDEVDGVGPEPGFEVKGEDSCIK